MGDEMSDATKGPFDARDLDAAVTALRMIRENDEGEAWSAGVAMSALASIEERHPAGCSFVSAAGVRCTKDRGHKGGHRPYPASWDARAPCRGGEGGHPCSLWPDSAASEGEVGSETPCIRCSDGDPAACVVCGKETDWMHKRYCREHANECKHERAIESAAYDVCNDCGTCW